MYIYVHASVQQFIIYFWLNTKSDLHGTQYGVTYAIKGVISTDILYISQ